jgi:hypothetical protein
MKISCMSPEQSEEEVQVDGEDESSASEEEDRPRQQRRKIIKIRPLSWRSERFEKLLESLDRKYLRRITEKARTMLKEKRPGESMVCDAPDDIPDWMIKH